MKTKKRDSGLKPLAAFGPPGFGFLSAVGTLPNRFSSVSFVAWVGSLLRWVKCNRSKVSGGRGGSSIEAQFANSKRHSFSMLSFSDSVIQWKNFDRVPGEVFGCPLDLFSSDALTG